MTHNNMNIIGQLFYHADAGIIANREALESVKNVIEMLLNSKEEEKLGFVKAFDSDGEGYKLYIELVRDEDFTNFVSPAEKAILRDSGNTTTITKDENNKAVVVKNGKVIGRQG